MLQYSSSIPYLKIDHIINLFLGLMSRKMSPFTRQTTKRALSYIRAHKTSPLPDGSQMSRIPRIVINYCVFPKNIVLFLNSASSAAALEFYLSGVCTHTDTEGKQSTARVHNILKSSGKNTIFNEHPVLQHT